MDKKFKISIIETEYFTNVEKKTVTCKIYYKIRTTDTKMDYVVNCMNMFVDGGMYADCVYTAVATAKTYPGDEFDQHKGEQISRAKAESIAYNRVNLFFKRLHKWYSQNIETAMSEFIEKSEGVISHNNRYIESF
jgi:hypothetical protein